MTSFLIALAFTGFVAGLAVIPMAKAYSRTNEYSKDVDEVYDGWGHDGWMQLDVTAYNSGNKLGALDLDMDCGGATWDPYTIERGDWGTTKVSDYVKIAWSDFECIEWEFFWFWWVVKRTETPQMNQRVEYLGEGGFAFEVWTNS